VCPPRPEALGAALDRLWAHRSRAEAWGRAGQQHYADLDLGWSTVIDRLLH
jgi:hypothetical protein